MAERRPNKRPATDSSPAEVLGTRYESSDASPGFALWQVATIWQRAVRVALTEVDLTHAQFVLLVSAAWLHSARKDEIVTQALIAEHAKTDAVMTSEVLRTLERKQLVRRLPHPTDARARQIVLTPSGTRLARRAIILVENVDETFFRSPGPELQMLARLICPARVASADGGSPQPGPG